MKKEQKRVKTIVVNEDWNKKKYKKTYNINPNIDIINPCWFNVPIDTKQIIDIIIVVEF